MLFPQFKNSQFGQINLEAEAVNSRSYQKINGKNPLLNPTESQKLIDQFHHRYQLAWSYGGWMENRRKLWSGSYLDQQRTHLHLGVDYNVPQDTEVALPWDAKIIRIDHDSDTEGGWGGRIIVEPVDSKLSNHLFIFAHLSDQITAKIDNVIKKASIIGTVGKPEVNGGWFSHLHIQALTKAKFHQVMENDLADLDGYGSYSRRKELRTEFPDPNKFLQISN